MGAPFTAPTWTADAQTGTISVRRWAANPKGTSSRKNLPPTVTSLTASVQFWSTLLSALPWSASASLPTRRNCHSLSSADTVHLKSSACYISVRVDMILIVTKKSAQELQCSTVVPRLVRHSKIFVLELNAENFFSYSEFDLQGAGCESPLFQWLATTARKFGFLRSNQHRQSEWTWFSNPPSQVPFSPMASCEQKPNAAPAVNTDQLPVDDPLFPTDNDQVADFDTNSEIAA